MSMRLAARRIPQGRDAASIRKWAMIFLTVGIIGQGIIQNRLLHMNSVSGDELLAAMEHSPMVMPLLTVALIFKVVETCAAGDPRRRRAQNDSLHLQYSKRASG